MRRVTLHEPVTWMAPASRWIGLFAVVVMLFGLGLLRFGHVDLPDALAVLTVAPAIALLAVLLALLAFVVIWRDGARGLGAALAGIVLALVVLAGPAYVLVEGLRAHRPQDVATDVARPPAFSLSRAALAARHGVTPSLAPGVVRQASIPGRGVVEPLDLDVPMAPAFNAALKVARDLGWDVVEAIPGKGRVGIGRIDAVDHTPILRLPVDITIRFTPRAQGVRVDVRTVVRHGIADFALAVGAERIEQFLDALSDATDESAEGSAS
ncbi:DUF1499 domain-containing protein [Chelatococcus asaccharovorans]|uniref:Uncharacterized protein DUF1499 n=1 Tax=Chelatococcus asaccharovorans TaxID=28210 RepID=A0A2V3U364_9HYPH|nr:DUF1499 domain-containing protein [Chelatococcus asaccharovorans]MBS7702384.1 DUF1499 domain-containing protein [Chelatococcus asaccharovorans]PXW56414.1 uncharacterized protein DUF1499 [Chelatococcus asaccharovorans]